MAAGSVLTLYLLYGQVAGPLRDIHRMRDEANEAAIKTQRAFSMMDEAEDVFFSRTGGVGEVSAQSGLAVSITDARASYVGPGGRRVPVLQGVNLSVPVGSFVGLCGQTGSGKTTLIKATAGLLRDWEGEIELFGSSLRTIAPEALAQSLAYASQQPYLIAGTVRENVLFGLNRNCGEDEIIDAMRAAAIWEDSSTAFPEGLDTPLGENGLGLSGGEKQRLVLARLFLRKPRLLILDEATSALDNITEQTVMRNLSQLDTTILAIAHRLSTLATAETIFVLDSGRVVEQGTYSSLDAAGGLFHGLLAASELAIDPQPGDSTLRDCPLIECETIQQEHCAQTVLS